MNAVAAAGAPAVAAVIANPIDVLFAGISANPYFIGLMMLLLNLGGRFLALEISKDQEKFLSQPMVRRFFLFAVLFVATRNILIAASLAIIVILFLGYLFNENSDLCLWKSCHVKPVEEKKQEGFIGLTAEEAIILKRLQDKQMAAATAAEASEKEVAGSKETDIVQAPPASSVYQRVLSLLQGGGAV
jgi:ethanolamine transporter EutH